MSKRWLYLNIIVCLLLLLMGCTASDRPDEKTQALSSLTNQDGEAEPELANGSDKLAPSNTSLLQPRAYGEFDGGEIAIVPLTSESIESITTCQGENEAFSFNGDYDVIYKDGSGNAKVIMTLEDLTIVHPNKEPLALGSISLKDTHIFYFIPEPDGCGLVQMYMFSVDDKGQAFAWTFENTAGHGEKPTQSLLVLPQKPPLVEQGKLTVSTLMNIGQNTEDLKQAPVSFIPDSAQHIMRLANQEP